MEGEKRFWRPYRVVALLPEAEELKMLGLEGRWYTCAITQENGKITAAVNELKDTMYRVLYFSFTAPAEYVNPEKRRASLLCTPGGNKLKGRSYERNGIHYISNLRHFVLVTTNCYRRRREDVITEWEISFVRFFKESRKGHSIEVTEEVVRISMPTTLRARYTLGDRMKKPLPSYDEVLAEITTEAERIKDGELRQKILKFAAAMAVTYIKAFGGQAEMPVHDEKPETAETVEETVLAATGTDNVAPLELEVDPSIAEQQASAMAAAKTSRQRRGKGKK